MVLLGQSEIRQRIFYVPSGWWKQGQLCLGTSDLLPYCMPLAVLNSIALRKGPLGTQQREPASEKQWLPLVFKLKQYSSLGLVVTREEMRIVSGLPRFQVPPEKKKRNRLKILTCAGQSGSDERPPVHGKVAHSTPGQGTYLDVFSLCFPSSLKECPWVKI